MSSKKEGHSYLPPLEIRQDPEKCLTVTGPLGVHEAIVILPTRRQQQQTAPEIAKISPSAHIGRYSSIKQN